MSKLGREMFIKKFEKILGRGRGMNEKTELWIIL
jgi:hypothetical protein